MRLAKADTAVSLPIEPAARVLLPVHRRQAAGQILGIYEGVKTFAIGHPVAAEQRVEVAVQFQPVAGDIPDIGDISGRAERAEQALGWIGNPSHIGSQQLT